MSEDERSSSRLFGGVDHQQLFEEITAAHNRELLVHCYRILGSFEDAEDALQETWIRAWRRIDTFEGRGSIRAWLYKIATNSALDAVASRRSRSLPRMTAPPADPSVPVSPPWTESIWIEPFPNSLLASGGANPDAVLARRESISLAFLAVLQLLPGRQRAALLLRDGLEWSVPEVAEMLDTSIAAVNSALQRARATMKDFGLARLDEDPMTVADDRTGVLLKRYVLAWESGDISALAALLREDAAMSMPPLTTWYSGRAAITEFLAAILLPESAQGGFRLVPTRANDAPAFAVYQRDDTRVFRPASLQLLTVKDVSIVAIDSFLAFDSALFARFDLSPFLDR